MRKELKWYEFTCDRCGIKTQEQIIELDWEDIPRGWGFLGVAVRFCFEDGDLCCPICMEKNA